MNVFCNIRGRINLGHIPYLFINVIDFRFGQWLCVDKSRFPSQTTDFAYFVAKFYYLLAFNQAN